MSTPASKSLMAVEQVSNYAEAHCGSGDAF